MGDSTETRPMSEDMQVSLRLALQREGVCGFSRRAGLARETVMRAGVGVNVKPEIAEVIILTLRTEPRRPNPDEFCWACSRKFRLGRCESIFFDGSARIVHRKCKAVRALRRGVAR